MTRPGIAHHLVALNTSGPEVPSEIHLLPRGVFKGRDGRGPYKVSDPSRIIAATKAHQRAAKLPVDFDHQLEHQKDGEAVRAAGWISALTADADGIHGRVEWTPSAARMIADREFRYVSPVFFHTKAGDVTRLASVALTNRPNLDLMALNRESPIMSVNQDDLLRSLREQLGQPPEADAATVLAAASEALGVSAPAAHATTPDPREWVPIGEYRRVCQELHAVDNRMSAHIAERHVNDLVANGCLLPFQREWAVALCRADKAALDQFVEEVGPKTHQIFEALTTRQITGAPPSGDPGIDDGRRAVAEAMGLDPATMRTIPKGN